MTTKGAKPRALGKISSLQYHQPPFSRRWFFEVKWIRLRVYLMDNFDTLFEEIHGRPPEE